MARIPGTPILLGLLLIGCDSKGGDSGPPHATPCQNTATAELRVTNCPITGPPNIARLPSCLRSGDLSKGDLPKPV